MKNSTVRLVIVLAAFCIAGITCIQLYWVNRAFNLKESEFQRTVTTALFNVAQRIYEITNTPSPANNPVKQLSTNYYVVMVNSQLNPSTLEFLLKTEFERRNIKTDFEYGVYDCTNEKMVYGNYVPLNTSNDPSPSKSFPTWLNQGYYFGVQFPNREAHILNQMGIWIFSSGVLLLVVIFFIYTLFVILRQKRLSEVQRDFINNMTHEFKTPISTIAVSTGVLKDEAIVHYPDRLAKYVGIIEKENQRLHQQVDRVLQFARFDKGDIEMKKEQHDAHEIINETIQAFASTLNQRNGLINFSPSSKSSIVHVDKLHFMNALFNLLDNAVKYGSDNPLIQIHTHNKNDRLCIDVKDNGMGIRSEDLKKIFQKFYRVPSGNVHDVKGFGIGLSYVDAVIRAHDGRIGVTSEIGKGSLFTIHLKTVL